MYWAMRLLAIVLGLISFYAMAQENTDERAVLEWLKEVPFAEADNPRSTCGSAAVDYEAWLNVGRKLKEAETVLDKLLATRDDRVNLEQVAYALGWLGGTRSGPVLVEALSDSGSRVRTEAAASLGRIHFIGAVDPLCKLLAYDDDHNVRANAAWALGRIGGPAARRCLEQAQTDGNEFVRELVNSALRDMQKEGPIPRN